MSTERLGPIIPDEAVEAAARELYRYVIVHREGHECEPPQTLLPGWLNAARFILAAAYAHDPTRAATDEVVRAALSETYEIKKEENMNDALALHLSRINTGAPGDGLSLVGRQSKAIREDIESHLDVLVEVGLLKRHFNGWANSGGHGTWPTTYEAVPSSPPLPHTPVAFNIHAEGFISRKCATCGQWLPAVTVQMPFTLSGISGAVAK